MIELMVSVGMISLLISVSLPAVQKTREAARQTQCKNNLKQLAKAVHTFEATYAKLPPSDLGDGWATWAALLLPFIEQRAAHDHWDFKRSYYAQSQECSLDPAVFHCPSRAAANRVTGDMKVFAQGLRTGPRGWSDYVASAGTEIDAGDGAFVRALSATTGRTVAIPLSSPAAEFRDPIYPIRFRDFIDGQSTTILFGEKHLRPVPNEKDPSVYNADDFWSYRRACGPALGLAPGPNYSEILGRRLFGSNHPGICNFAFADGSVRHLSVAIDRVVLGKLATRCGGEVVSSSDY